MLTWNQVCGEFYCDGSWRDIYVLDTRIEHWQQALDALRRAYPQLAYTRAGMDSLLPTDATEAFPDPGFADCFLKIDLGGPTLNCHFFTDEEIEFDLNPREVENQQDFEKVIQFMRLLANATQRDTIVTPENQNDIIIFRVRPNNQSVEHKPFGGYQ